MEDKNMSKLLDVPITVSIPLQSFKDQAKTDCKRRRANEEVTIMELPRVIIVEILSRLPIKSIFRSKTVCKSWYYIFSDPLFLNLHYTRPPFPCILISVDGSISSILELKADYDYCTHPQNRPIMLSPKFHLPQLKSHMIYDYSDYGAGYANPELEMIGSCNGLICLLDGDKRDPSVYISNPLLGEYFQLKLPEWDKRVRGVAYAFCFSETSGHYKVLRAVAKKFRGRPQVSELEVFTLGFDLKWRNLGEAPYPLRGSFGHVNGALHWLDDEDHEKSARIYSFNIGTEKVKSLPAPRGLDTPSFCLMLTELGNYLCLVDHSCSQYVDIWWMKEYGLAESWSRDRILLDSIPRAIRYKRFIPIMIWNDGEILIQSYHGTLLSYNPKMKKFRQINVYGSGTATARYTPSFYSLKTLMGVLFQVSNVYPKTEIV